MWIICGALSLIFCVIGFIMVKKDNRIAYWASASSLAFVSLTLLMEYKMVVDWVNREDWSALLDVAPHMFSLLTGYVVIMLLLNAVVIGLTKRER